MRFIFRCQFCAELPDPLTQLSLTSAMRESTWGAYQDVLPDHAWNTATRRQGGWGS